MLHRMPHSCDTFFANAAFSRDIVPTPLAKAGHNLRSSLERGGLRRNLWRNCGLYDSPEAEGVLQPCCRNCGRGWSSVSEQTTNGETIGEPTRRDFLYLTTGMAGAVGAVAVAWPFIDQMRPDASTLALASIEVDVTSLEPGMSL